jgi:hypothetical protein
MGRCEADEAVHVPIVFPDSDFPIDHFVDSNEPQHTLLAGRESPSLRMLVDDIGAVGHQQTVVVLVARQRLEPHLEPFHDVFGTARRQRRDRHVDVEAVVCQERLDRIPIPPRKRLP